MRGRRNKSSSQTSVVGALVGDLLVAASKIGAAIWTGSAAMASEAIHSVVDTTNEILLLYGIHRSKQKADAEHPFGHGREVYFWSFVVSLLIFALGAGFSIYEGVSRVLKPVPIESPGISYVVLALAFIFEGGSWLVSLKQFREAKGELGFFDAFRISKDPPSFMTLFEDSVALIGILIAAASTFAAAVLARPEIDGIASVGIGLLLAATSVFLARESKSLLIGEPASASSRRRAARHISRRRHWNGSFRMREPAKSCLRNRLSRQRTPIRSRRLEQGRVITVRADGSMHTTFRKGCRSHESYHHRLAKISTRPNETAAILPFWRNWKIVEVL
jgi:cation diffusion facilitator family transporter